jgi:hypothetical protein
MWLRRFRSRLPRSSRSAAATRRPSPFKPAIDALEQRDVPAIFTVTNTGEFGLGSPRPALLLADFHQDAPGEVDRIVFNLAGAGSGRRPATPSPRGRPTRPGAESTDLFARFLAFRPRVPGKVFSPCTGASAVRPPAALAGG